MPQPRIHSTAELETPVQDMGFLPFFACSKDLTRLDGFGADGLKGFDTVITNPQMRTYVTVHSFEYA